MHVYGKISLKATILFVFAPPFLPWRNSAQNYVPEGVCNPACFTVVSVLVQLS